MSQYILAAAAEIFQPAVLIYIVFGVLLGYVVGALPGMNRTTAIAVSLPFTFTMSPAAAISFLIGINKGGAAGSAVSAILLNIPGEASSAVTAYDGYPMARSGKAQKALKAALFGSVIGDVLATAVLIALARPLADFAIGLGPFELAAILIFSITFIAAVAGDSFFKALIAGFFGLLLSAPGLDIETGLPRMTFGLVELFDGVPVLSVAIGTLAMSQVLSQTDKGWRGKYTSPDAEVVSTDESDKQLSKQEFKQITPAIMRGSIVGTLIGILPGLGATLASFLAYTWVQKSSKTPERFGKGAPEGVAASEAADNATVPAALVPVFAIGVPGSLSTALLMGAFMMHDLTPGPFLFRENATVVYSIYIGMIVASAALLLVGFFGQTLFAAALRVRGTILWPVIVFLCVCGAYIQGGTMFGVYLMLIFGFIGYFMRKFDYSFVTFVVGYLLGPMAELTIRQTIILSARDPWRILDHPIALLFLALTVFAVWRFTIAGMRSMRLSAAG